ncbi:MAG: acetyl-CoA carboxylase biotin carboxyl carrier protein [Phycisphaerales bacterium]|nr:acetyl-CoA carboxylase biotin carboxyl carrier protein [Planctomycetota bacterium]
MIDANKLKDLVKLMVDNDLTEIDLQDEKETVTIRRGHAPVAQPMMYAAPSAPAGAPAPAPASSPAAAPAAGGGGGGGGGSDAGLVAIESPMVGTFYSAANPDSAPFVTAGAKITPSTVVCLIEAMKVFNEIKAEKPGTIERVLVKSGEAVEFGQKLFLVRPA